MTQEVIITLQVEGLHSWPEAKDIFPSMAFLSHPHRHIFYIKACKQVSHDDRDVEIIMLKREVNFYLSKYFDPKKQIHDFGRLSCEQIARELSLVFKFTSCEVLEDNENGARFSIPQAVLDSSDFHVVIKDRQSTNGYAIITRHNWSVHYQQHVVQFCGFKNECIGWVRKNDITTEVIQSLEPDFLVVKNNKEYQITNQSDYAGDNGDIVFNGTENQCKQWLDKQK